MILRFIAGFVALLWMSATYFVCGLLWITIWPGIWRKADLVPKRDFGVCFAFMFGRP